MSPWDACIYVYMIHKASFLPLLRRILNMSHFECRLHQCFWRSKKLYKLSKLEGGNLDKIQKNSSFFSGYLPWLWIQSNFLLKFDVFLFLSSFGFSRHTATGDIWLLVGSATGLSKFQHPLKKWWNPGSQIAILLTSQQINWNCSVFQSLTLTLTISVSQFVSYSQLCH